MEEESLDAALSVLELNIRASFNHNIDFSARTIRLDGEIGEGSFSAIDSAITLLEHNRPKDVKGSKITLVINSGGGDLDEASAIIGRIHASPCQIDTVVYGYAASAAFLVFAAGKVRSMSETAELMYHQASVRTYGTAADIEEVSKQLNKAQAKWADWLSKRTKKGLQWWLEIYKAKVDATFTAQECIKIGIANKILKEKK